MAVLRLAWATFGRALFGRAAAIACGVGLVLAILFAPQGLRAADVVRWTDPSPIARLCPWMLWMALVVPPVGAALRAPGISIARTLPIASSRLASIFGAFVLVLHAPWTTFFLRGAGTSRAIASTALAVACVGGWVAPIRFLPIVAVALAASFAPPVVGIVLGVPLAIVAIERAWRYGGEPHSVWIVPIPRSAPLAILASYAMVLARRERVRALLAVGLVVSSAAIGVRIDRLGWMLAPSLCIAGGAIAPVLAREASRLRWIAPRPWLPHAMAIAMIPQAAPLYPFACRWTRGGSAWALAVLAYAVVVTCVWRIACCS